MCNLLAFDAVQETLIPWLGWLAVQALFALACFWDWYKAEGINERKFIFKGLILSIFTFAIVFLALALDLARIFVASNNQYNLVRILERSIEYLGILFFPLWIIWVIVYFCLKVTSK